MLLLKRSIRTIEDDYVDLRYDLFHIDIMSGAINFNANNMIALLELNQIDVSIEELQEIIDNMSSEFVCEILDNQSIVYMKQFFEHDMNEKLSKFNCRIELHIRNEYPVYYIYY